MPPFDMVTKDHLKQILQGEKKLLKMSKVQFVNKPYYDETGVKRLYLEVLKMPGMVDYFPDRYPKGRQCDLTNMYNVWHSLYPEEVQEVIKHANNQRFSMTA